LSLDDPLVSRKHALLIVEEESVTIQDLGSRNGVSVNGEDIEGVTSVQDGDTITIGSQDLQLYASDLPEVGDRGWQQTNAGAVTMTNMPSPDLAALQVERDVERVELSDDPGEKTTKRDAFRLLGGVADKALALGRSMEAERLLRSLLMHVMENERSGKDVDEVVREQAGYYAARLARATGKGAWVDYVVELHSLTSSPCSARTIDLLHEVLRKVKDGDVSALRSYVDRLRDNQATFGPADLFLLQRIEGLVRLLTAQ
jgi:hypothetical protein